MLFFIDLIKFFSPVGSGIFPNVDDGPFIMNTRSPIVLLVPEENLEPDGSNRAGVNLLKVAFDESLNRDLMALILI
jgi:hypothetical protein